MSTATRLSALLCCCTSLALVGVPAEDPAPTAVEVRAELELAADRGLYLVVDPAAERLEVKVRGWAVHTVVLEDTSLVAPARLGRAAVAPIASTPAVLRVESAPTLPQAAVVAPAALRPFDPDAAAAAPAPPPPPPPPSSYLVPLEDGLVLLVGRAVPGRSGLGRAAAAVADGWRRLLRRPQESTPGLALAVSEEDAQRLFHLFQPGLPILVLGPSPPA